MGIITKPLDGKDGRIKILQIYDTISSEKKVGVAGRSWEEISGIKMENRATSETLYLRLNRGILTLEVLEVLHMTDLERRLNIES